MPVYVNLQAINQGDAEKGEKRGKKERRKNGVGLQDIG
jgi:hypothetical protein